MPKTNQAPAIVLNSLIEKYQLNPFSLSKAISLNYSTVHQILKGKAKITVPTALRLAKFFGQPSVFWLDLQRETDLIEAAKDKKLSAVLKGISKVKKSSARVPAARKPVSKTKAKAKPVKRNTLPAKRKTAARTSVAKSARRKRS